MTHATRLIVVMAAMTLIAVNPARANQILEMADEAETIVIGEGIVDEVGADTAIEFNVRAELVLKGQANVGSTVKAAFPLPLNAGSGQIYFERLAPPSGAYGLWFLQGESNSFMRVPKEWIIPKGVDVHQLLLLAVVESYRQSLTDADLIRKGETAIAKRRMNNSLQYAGRFGAEAVALEIVEDLMESVSGEQLENALAIGIGMSYDPALVRLIAELESLRPNSAIFSALENSYTPTQGVAPLESLIRANQTIKVSGLDSALAGALRRVSKDTILPMAALLLDSPDETAVRRAAGYFYVYTTLARQDGSVSTDGTDSGVHPYKNAATQAYNGHDETLAASTLANFWRGWWSDNQHSIAH